MKILKIEIVFPVSVILSNEDQKQLDDFVRKICQRYEAEHPGRVMWPCSCGFQPTYIPMTAEEEMTRGMEFDESIYQIETNEREAYPGEQ